MRELTAEAFSECFPTLVTGLGGDDVQSLLEALELHEVAAGEAVIAEWTTTDAVFLVWEGELDVVMDTPGGERKVARIGPGEFLGEVSLMDPGPATASVVAEAGCVTLRMSRANFDRLCSSKPALASALLQELLRSLSHRLRSATERLNRLRGDREGAELGPVDDEVLVAVHADLYEGASRA